ncbi:hypothetical protein THRCLA_20520 [Thraustotheca clavata]|uniref:Uncharacterized protein n=1 Tax=Thraustotheca clavata TaxID=74557 RepID=A0A1W0A6G3_9STRA|nr:hypothetical protein THRCLA_20520 [Thraustotheca clavata]
MESGFLADCNQVRNNGRPGYEYLGVDRSLDENYQVQEQELEQDYQDGGYGTNNGQQNSNPSYGNQVKPNDYQSKPNDYTNNQNGNYEPANKGNYEPPKNGGYEIPKNDYESPKNGNYGHDQPKEETGYRNKGHEHEHSFWHWGGDKDISYDKKDDNVGKSYGKKDENKDKSYGKGLLKPSSYGNGPKYGDGKPKYDEDWGHKAWGKKPAWVPAYFDWPPHKEYFTHHYHHANGKWVDSTENPSSISTPTTKICTVDEHYAQLDRPEWYPHQLAWPPTTCSDKWDATSVGYKSAALQLTDTENTNSTFMEKDFIEIVGACTFIVFIVGIVFARKSARLLRELKEQQMLFEDNSHYQPLL